MFVLWDLICAVYPLSRGTANDCESLPKPTRVDTPFVATLKEFSTVISQGQHYFETNRNEFLFLASHRCLFSENIIQKVKQVGEMYFITQNVKNAKFVLKWPHSLLLCGGHKEIHYNFRQFAVLFHCLSVCKDIELSC